MSIIEDYDCVICTNTLRAPVKLKIFESTIEHQCWEKHRLCLRCARKYLRMDEKRSEKFGTCKKCPFCMSEKTTTDISFLNARITYKKDKVLYKKINELISNGTLPKMNCECGESTCSCFQCNKKLKRKDLQEHITNECVQCSCGKFMPRKWLDYHIEQECN